jgi:hypothetical protein
MLRFGEQRATLLRILGGKRGGYGELIPNDRNPGPAAAKPGSRESTSADMIDSVASSGNAEMRLDLDG